MHDTQNTYMICISIENQIIAKWYKTHIKHDVIAFGCTFRRVG